MHLLFRGAVFFTLVLGLSFLSQQMAPAVTVPTTAVQTLSTAQQRMIKTWSGPLLARQDVQRELGISELQQQEIEHRLVNLRHIARTIYCDVDDRWNSAAQSTDMTLLRYLEQIEQESLDALKFEFHAGLHEFLEPSQLRRLNQLQRQSEGLNALLDEQTAMELDLSEQQIAQLQRLPIALFRRFVPQRDQAAALRTLESILTTEQQRCWQAIRGPGFTFDINSADPGWLINFDKRQVLSEPEFRQASIRMQATLDSRHATVSAPKNPMSR